MSDSKDSVTLSFTTPEEFNEEASFICKDAYSEVAKFKDYFEKTIIANGMNSYSPTVAVFSMMKNFVGIVTCRETKDKDDLYCAMAEMLQFPTSVASNLFIVSNDITMTRTENGQSVSSDGLIITFVTPDHCLVLSIPYSFDETSKQFTWHDDQAYVTKISKITQSNSAIGDLLELYFVFSHGSSTGGFSPEEVLSYFDSNGFIYEIFNSKAIEDRNSFGIPFSARI